MRWDSCENRAITILSPSLPPSLPPFSDDAPAASCFQLRQLMNTYMEKKKVNAGGGWRDEGKLISQQGCCKWSLQRGWKDLNQAFLPEQMTDERLAHSMMNFSAAGDPIAFARFPPLTDSSPLKFKILITSFSGKVLNWC